MLCNKLLSCWVLCKCWESMIYRCRTHSEETEKQTHFLNIWNGRGRGPEITEVPQGPPRYGSSLLTVRLTKLVKMTPSLCWLQELAHFSDIIQRSNQMKRSDTAWSKGWAHLFRRDGVQAVSMARLTTIFYTTVWEMIQNFFLVLLLSLPGVVVPVFDQGLADSPAFFTLRYSFSERFISLQ